MRSRAFGCSVCSNMLNARKSRPASECRNRFGWRTTKPTGIAAGFTLNTPPLCVGKPMDRPSGPLNRLPCQPNSSSRPSIGWPVSTPLPRHDPTKVGVSTGASESKKAPPQLLCRFQVDAAVGLVVLRVSTDLLWQYLRSEAGTKAWPNILPSPRRLSQMLLSKGDGGSRCPLGCLLPAMHTHYQWADIPRALVKQWTAQRPRRSRTIRELDATRPAEPAV